MDTAAGATDADTSPALPSHRPSPYATADQCRAQLKLLVQFASARNQGDIIRLVYFIDAFEQTFRSLPTIAAGGEWTKLIQRLAVALLDSLRSLSNSSVPVSAVNSLLQGTVFLTSLIPKQMASIADVYFNTMAFLTTNMSKLRPESKSALFVEPEAIKESVLALLKPITSETTSAYEAFATSYLIIPDLESFLGKLDGFASEINYRMLALAVSAALASPNVRSGALDSTQNRTWILSYLIFFHRYALGAQENTRSPELEFVAVVSELLNSTATYLGQGLEAEDPTDLGTSQAARPLHPFIKDQVSGLINQNSVTGLLSPIRSSRISPTNNDSEELESSKEARVLATYALNLLRIFPRRGDDIRMWLYLGSAPSGEQISGQAHAKIPAIKYFWQASRTSRVFQIISSDSNKVLPLLQLPEHAKEPVSVPQEQRAEEWTTILLFLELYTFVLKVMDDDEFFSSTSSFTSMDNNKISWTRESALPLSDIKDMTIFLKNLAFTLYWNAVDLSEPELRPTAVNLSSYFNSTGPNMPQSSISNDVELESKSPNNYLPGVTGIPLEYFKGLVTGLLRMLHERE